MKTGTKITRTTMAGDINIRLSTDMMMGIAGCCMAVASTSFGIYMTVHGPAPGVGASHDFTVFAQFAPRTPAAARHKPVTRDDDLDLTSTASIPGTDGNGGKEPDDRVGSVLASAVVEGTTDDAATIAIGGHLRTVRVGDSLPEGGDVLTITQGPRPSVTTTRGVIRSARAD